MAERPPTLKPASVAARPSDPANVAKPTRLREKIPEKRRDETKPEDKPQ